jgi:hypothetical protein
MANHNTKAGPSQGEGKVSLMKVSHPPKTAPVERPAPKGGKP